MAVVAGCTVCPSPPLGSSWPGSAMTPASPWSTKPRTSKQACACMNTVGLHVVLYSIPSCQIAQLFHRHFGDIQRYDHSSGARPILGGGGNFHFVLT